MIRVLIADDHPVVRQGLASLLDAVDDLTVVASAVNGAEAVRLVVEHRPHVAIVDLEMPELDGAAATRQIRAQCPETQVVILTSYADHHRILSAIDAGAIAYLEKDTDPQELIRAVRAAAAGRSLLGPSAATALLADRGRTRPADTLTAREREVLAMLGEGLPNKLIARRMGISEKTVKGHLTKIYDRLGVTDRTQAVLVAQRLDFGALS
jgi:DNA-binding NarL/FixJ family response regulator